MTDRTSFEQRLAEELERTAGPRRPVDARAIRQAATAPTGRLHRWWPLSHTTRDTPITIQHLAVRQGRTRTMFSATKLVAGAAVLALAGGLIYAGILPGEAEQPVPAGAEAQRTDFIIVTGTSTMSAGGSPSGDDSMSDPRVTGHANLINNYLIGDEDSTGVNWGPYTLANDDGSWEGEWIGFYEPPSDEDDYGTPGAQNAMIWAIGTGDYEGWSYVANYTGRLLGLDVKGLIYQGPIPPTMALGLLETEPE